MQSPSRESALSNAVNITSRMYPEVLRDIDTYGFATIDVPALPLARRAATLLKASVLVGQSFDIGSMFSLYFSELIDVPLFPFQHDGVAWMTNNSAALLADDMGLGKTIQAVAAARACFINGTVTNALVVCPRTLVLNWVAEFQKWAPELAVTPVLPNGKSAEPVWRRRVGCAQIIITSYDQVRTNSRFLTPQAQLLIADEAHKLRNRGSALAKAMRHLEPKLFWMLTGTPVERHAEDLATLLSLLKPKQFAFSDHKYGLPLLREWARPFVLRRLKSEVLKDLPPLTMRHEVISLSDEQRTAYKQALATNSPNILATFSRLRAICDIDPTSEESSKIDRVVELLDGINALGERAVVFSFWKRPLSVLARRLEASQPGSVQLITGEMTLVERAAAVVHFKTSSVTLLASARVASEGLTLTEANHAIFLNRWWNPSSNNQANDRIRRIGQSKGTFVYTFTAAGTIEELVDAILTMKNVTIKNLVDALAEHLARAKSESLP